MTHSIAHFTPPYIIYNCLVKHRKQRVCLHLVAQDSHGSAVLIMMADNTMEPLRFGIRSEHLYPEALHTAMSCITHITTVKLKKKKKKKEAFFPPYQIVKSMLNLVTLLARIPRALNRDTCG